jgi:hypothetical protein
VANYIVSYDLNGPTPTHHEMDEHMGDAGWTRGRILETVWYVGTDQTETEVYQHINTILSEDDQLIVVCASSATFRDLLIDAESLEAAWEENS